jgi:hypothetical protein
MLPGSVLSTQCVFFGTFGDGSEKVEANIDLAEEDEEGEGKDAVE